MTNKYIHAARTLQELYDEAQLVVNALSEDEIQEYMNQRQIISIEYSMNLIKNLESVVGELQRKIKL